LPGVRAASLASDSPLSGGWDQTGISVEGYTPREDEKMDLDLTRKQISIALSQMEEGRASLRQVEDLRVAEIEKWTAFYDAQNVLEKAKLALLRQTGSIVAALQ